MFYTKKRKKEENFIIYYTIKISLVIQENIIINNKKNYTFTSHEQWSFKIEVKQKNPSLKQNIRKKRKRKKLSVDLEN